MQQRVNPFTKVPVFFTLRPASDLRTFTSFTFYCTFSGLGFLIVTFVALQNLGE